VKRALPFLLFAAVTVTVFWKFLLFGQTMYAMSALESQLGKPVQEPRGWFRSEYRHTRIADNLALLALHLRIYNEGLHHGEIRLWNPYLLCGLPETRLDSLFATKTGYSRDGLYSRVEAGSDTELDIELKR